MNRAEIHREVQRILPPAAAAAVIECWVDGWSGCTIYVPQVALAVYEGYARRVGGTARFLCETEAMMRTAGVPPAGIHRFWALIGGRRINL